MADTLFIQAQSGYRIQIGEVMSWPILTEKGSIVRIVRHECSTYLIADLERGETDSLRPYLWYHVDYMLDEDWGDVSEMAHYCYESRPFTDTEQIRARIPELPAGYLRDTADFPAFNEAFTAFMQGEKVTRTCIGGIPHRAGVNVEIDCIVMFDE